MRKIADIAAYLFILAITFLSTISVLSVWNVLAGDVVLKSFQTIGLLAVVAAIVLIASRFIDKESPDHEGEHDEDGRASSHGSYLLFRGVRMITLCLLITSTALLALLGILAIWEVLSGEVLNRSLASISIVAFSTLVIVVMSLERERSPALKRMKLSSGGFVVSFVLTLVFLIFLLQLFA
jgi:uncharacterized membrane protein